MKLQKEVSFILVQGGGGAIHTKWFHDPHKGFEYFHNHPNWPRTFCGLQIMKLGRPAVWNVIFFSIFS